MRLIALLIVCCVLSGCATTAKYEENLKSWIGHDDRELFSSWGPPFSVYELSKNEKLVTYTRSNNVMLPGTAPSYTTNVIGSTAYSTPYGGTAPMNINLHCKTTFTITDHVITNWRWEGNDCTSR